MIFVILSGLMYERYRTYKSLYSKYRNMRPGTREMSSEVISHVFRVLTFQNFGEIPFIVTFL